MTLRKKTLFIIGVTLACLIVLLYSTSSAILVGGFAQVEKQNTQRNVQRAHEALSDDIAQLNTMTRDWAWWDDTYRFIQDANPEFIKANPTNEGLAGLRVNLMVFVNSSGQIVFWKGFDLQENKEILVPESFHALLSADSVLLQHNDTESNVTGIVKLPEGYLLVASRPILTSEGKGPIKGTLIFGRYLNSAEIERLAGITHLSITVFPFSDEQTPDDFPGAGSPSSEGAPILVKPLSEQSIAGYTAIRDIYGNPAFVLRVDLPRAIYQQGQASVSYLFISLIVIGLIFGGMSIWLLEKMVLSRLAHLNADVTSIGASAELSKRVTMDGNDELSSLAGSINSTLEALERSQVERQRIEEELREHRDNLEELVEKRTYELKNTNKKLQLEIAERRRAEEELKKSEEKYRSLVESTEDSIYMVDRDCNYLFVNSKHLARLGIGDYHGRRYVDCHLSTETDKFVQGVNRVFETGKPEQQEHEYRGKWFMRTLNPVKDPETRKVIAVTVVSTDITVRKKAEEIRLENERLAFASKAKSEFLANMSHELRTPLNSIIGFSELMMQKIPGDLSNKQTRYVDNIITSSKFLLNLINDVLDLSKVEAGKIELVIERISVPIVVNETLSLLKEKAAKHNITLQKEMDPQLDFIEADNQRVKQILFNLLSNAVKFSKPEGGTVTITAEKEGDVARFSVSDTGIGIKEEAIGKLFKEFEQVDSAISKKYGGTGLGLAITRKLVELHGGCIEVESKYGEGSTFTFTLPLVAKTGEVK